MLKKIILSIFGIVGVMMLLWGVWLSLWGVLSAHWPSTDGVVLSSANTESTSGSDDITTYSAKVRYEFVINSRRYTSDRLSFGEFSDSDPGHAARIISRYPAGKPVRVYFNPLRPQMSVLEPGTGWGTYIPLILGAMFIAVSLIAKSAEKQVAENLVFSEKKARDNVNRILVTRDCARVTTNYPPFAIGMGAIFLVAGVGLLLFGLGGPDRAYAVVMGGFFAVAGGSLAWFAAKGLRLRNIRNRNAGRLPWEYDHAWDRSRCNEEGFIRAFRVLYAVTMITIFLVPLQILLMTHVKSMPDRIFIYFVAGLFNLGVTLGFARALFLLSRAAKFGKNRILFHCFPLPTGGEFTVTFVGGGRLCNQSMHADLECINEYYDSGTPVFELVYSQKCDFTTDAAGNADLTFSLPQDAVSTDLIGSPPFYWELVISAQLPGMDYRGTFLMPIYKTI